MDPWIDREINPGLWICGSTVLIGLTMNKAIGRSQQLVQKSVTHHRTYLSRQHCNSSELVNSIVLIRKESSVATNLKNRRIGQLAYC